MLKLNLVNLCANLPFTAPTIHGWDVALQAMDEGKTGIVDDLYGTFDERIGAQCARATFTATDDTEFQLGYIGSSYDVEGYRIGVTPSVIGTMCGAGTHNCKIAIGKRTWLIIRPDDEPSDTCWGSDYDTVEKRAWYCLRNLVDPENLPKHEMSSEGLAIQWSTNEVW